MAGVAGSGCGGPIGNQHAKGCTTNGRVSQYDLKHIASEMMEWSQTPDALKLTMFALHYYKKFGQILHVARFPEWEDKDQDFADAYRFTKQNMDIARFTAANEDRMPADWYKLRETVYCDTTHKHDRDNKRFESSLRKDEEQKSKQNITVNVNGRGLASGVEVQSETVSNSNHKGS